MDGVATLLCWRPPPEPGEPAESRARAAESRPRVSVAGLPSRFSGGSRALKTSTSRAPRASRSATRCTDLQVVAHPFGQGAFRVRLQKLWTGVGTPRPAVKSVAPTASTGHA